MAKLRTVAGIIGDIFAALLVGAPLYTMKQIKRENSVGDRWVLNYVATYANAVCMVAYSLPTKQYLVAIINAVAVVAEFGYSCFYRHYAQGRAKKIATWCIAGELLWGAGVLVGYFSAFFGGRSGAMYVAMFPDTWAVFRTHNVQNQNIMLLLFAIANCTCWTLYGMKPKDSYIESAVNVDNALPPQSVVNVDNAPPPQSVVNVELQVIAQLVLTYYKYE